ncbi:MAG TPA: hypothetical protein VGM33_23960 [Baekduia sp.]
MAEQRVSMLLLHYGQGPRDEQAREALAGALAGVQVTEPDDVGEFEVVLDAEDREAALMRVWNAVAASGTDDHIVFVEHPDIPEHWRAEPRPR